MRTTVAIAALVGLSSALLASAEYAGLKELIVLDGSGTTNPSKFFWEVISLFEARAKPPVKMTYRAVGSSTGQYEFTGYEDNWTAFSDFGSGDIPLTEYAWSTLREEGREVVHFPFVLGAMSFFHNIPDLPVSGVMALNMTACLLAKIFNRDITTWDDSEILAINPSLSVPSGQEIYVYHRVYGSSTTHGITTYLNSACPSEWPASQVGASVDWANGTYEAQGSSKMAAYLASVEYSIGYIDSGHGHDDELKEIELQNAAGLFQSSLEAAERGGIALAASQGLANGVVPTDPTASFANVSLHNMPGNVTWPIVALSYIYADVNQTEAGYTGALLKAFMEYIVSDDGQDLVEDYNFVSIPSAIMDVAEKAINRLLINDNVTQWTFEESTAKGSGQEDYVISEKRRAWFEYAISSNEDDISDLQDDLDDYVQNSDLYWYKAKIESLEYDVSNLTQAVNKLNNEINDNADSADTNEVLAIFAICFGVVVGIIAAFSLFKIMSFQQYMDSQRTKKSTTGTFELMRQEEGAPEAST